MRLGYRLFGTWKQTTLAMDNGNFQGIRSTCRVTRSFAVLLNLLGLGQQIPLDGPNMQVHCAS
jgi:hypothetical protein